MRAVVDFIVAPPEHHRRRRVPHLERRAAAPVRPPARRRDARRGPVALPGESATKGTELTGYPAISVYHEFRYHPKQVIGGAFDWIYEHLGMFSWVVEIWSPMREAGIENYKYIDWFRDHPIEDDLKLYRWSDDKLGGVAHIAWKPFDHPQLGQDRDRRLEPLPRVRQSAAGVPRARARALPEVAALAGADLAEAGAGRTPRPTRWATATGACGSSCRTPAGCRATCRSARWSARSCAASIAEIALPAGATLVHGKRARGRWASSKARRTSTPASRSGPTTT